MAEYFVKSMGTTRFNLSANDDSIGELEYKSWFTFKATVTLPDNSCYVIEPKGFWGTSIELKKEDDLMLTLKMDWVGNVIIKTEYDSADQD